MLLVQHRCVFSDLCSRQKTHERRAELSHVSSLGSEEGLKHLRLLLVLLIYLLIIRLEIHIRPIHAMIYPFASLLEDEAYLSVADLFAS